MHSLGTTLGTSFLRVPLYRSDQGEEASEAVEENFFDGHLHDWTWPVPDIDTDAGDRYGVHRTHMFSTGPKDFPEKRSMTGG